MAGALGGLLGEFLEGLPYASEVMGMTEREWNAMSAGSQARLLNQIEAKLRLYRDFSRSEVWTTLSGRRDAGSRSSRCRSTHCRDRAGSAAARR
ncbi:hypothetical protein ACFQU2_39070 [Siccirubricoccus deserti]